MGSLRTQIQGFSLTAESLGYHNMENIDGPELNGASRPMI